MTLVTAASNPRTTGSPALGSPVLSSYNGEGSKNAGKRKKTTPPAGLAANLTEENSYGTFGVYLFGYGWIWDEVMKTYLPKVADLEKKWWLVDAEGRVLGRLATQVAMVLMGKNKAEYTDFLDTGDFVVVINAGKVRLTGNKLDQKSYYRHSGYPGGLKDTSARDLLKKHPDRIITLAVKGMLPKTKLGRQMLKKLKVYGAADHPHQAQQPEPLSL